MAQLPRFTLFSLFGGIAFVSLICAVVANHESFFAFVFVLLAIVFGVSLLDRN